MVCIQRPGGSTCMAVDPKVTLARIKRRNAFRIRHALPCPHAKEQDPDVNRQEQGLLESAPRVRVSYL
ncbi:hypothetical protein OESDEN_23828 [Oesophagostomum dentatum]|uniref:Uncharacterized protein n=1 Tax=Oesophagostomum dentatum TaxID=61180 RepID=A0A0B1RZA3_OESDE|nr:hypothetical protein OESDEN_23828 [Oesophagostomum dentatum]